MTLEEFIQDCRRRRDERLQREETERQRQEDAYNELSNSLMPDIVTRAGVNVPEELRIFIVLAEVPTFEQLQGYLVSWFPCDFILNVQPHFVINFTAGDEGRVMKITVGGETFPDFIEAVAAASDPPEGVKL